MVRILAASAVVCLVACLLGVSGDETINNEKNLRLLKPNDFFQQICNTQGVIVRPEHICDPYRTTLATTTTTTTARPVVGDDSEDDLGIGDSSSTTTVSNSPLEQAHWCKFNNGSYASLNQKFLYNECTLCECTGSHMFRCTTLPCMATYCIDGKAPVKREGQCCKQCAYEKSSNSCMVNGYTFPHGTLIGQSTDNIQCWCQLGTVECRKGATSLLSGMDYWGEGTAVYVIIIIILAVLIVGTLLCCGGGLLFYYYYHNNQQSVQDAYAQYYSSAGWQPMGEDGQVIVDGVAGEKQAEAEQQQQYQYPTGQSEEYIPPPYALYTGSYANQPNGKEQNSA